MVRYIIGSILVVCCVGGLKAQGTLIKNLKAGKEQTLVVYGTSLSALPESREWVDSVGRALNQKFGNHLHIVNAAKSAMWSTWGVQHLEDSVIRKKPNAVLIEFAMNDAYLDYHTSPALAKLNLEYMVKRIKLYNPDCQVIVQIMNIPIDKHAEARPQIQRYEQVYRDVALTNHLLLIDHHANWQKILSRSRDEYLIKVPDGLHPSAESAKKIIAPYVLQRLLEGQ